MKPLRLSLSILMTLLALLTVDAQDYGRDSSQGASAKTVARKKPSAWVMADVTGRADSIAMDTLTYNYQRRVVPSFVSDALATTGNLGAPSQNQLWFSRRQYSEFFFNDALRPYLKTPYNTAFYNTYIPITQLSYSFGGSRDTGQDRLSGYFAGNVNRRIGVGAHIDYLYSKGSYDNQAIKDFSFGFTGYYKGDRYEAQALFNQWNMLNKENGGIRNELYITNPAELQGGVDKIDTKSIPTNLSGAHSRVRGKQFWLNHEFKIGYWQEQEVNDTLTREIYTPVVKIFHTLDYKESKHMFLDTQRGDQDFWDNHYLSLSETDDNTSFWRLGNTLGVQMIEGFKPWVKFNLSAYATYEFRRYNFMPYGVEPPSEPGVGDMAQENMLTPLPAGFDTDSVRNQNMAWVGGRLGKDMGRFNYDAAARFGILGGIAGDILIQGGINYRIPVKEEQIVINARGEFANTTVPTMLRHYVSNHFSWHNDFGKTREVKISGELTIPWTHTKVKAAMENIQNYVYFNTSGMPQQKSGNTQIVAVTLDQRLRFGIWNWNNTITYQTTTDAHVIPLPTLTIYSNMYLGFKAFRVLDLQIGVDCDYFTRYRGVRYQPATMSFEVGEDWKIGNYPFCNVYLTAKLYKTRFFVMMTHVNQGLFTKNYFSMPLYPLNPRRFQLGLSVDFAN